MSIIITHLRTFTKS